MTQEDILPIALQYLERLHHDGYFEKKHTDCSWLYYKDEPACANSEISRRVDELLKTQGYVQIVQRSLDEMKAEGTLETGSTVGGLS